MRASEIVDEGAEADRLPRLAWALGLLGLVPFLAMAGLLAYAGRDFILFPELVLALSGYGATILAFLGGIRWGAALPGRRAHDRRRLAFSVAPSLAGWALLLVPAPWSFLGLAAAILAQGAWDLAAVRQGVLPEWFGRLRLALTAGAALSMLVAFAATLN